MKIIEDGGDEDARKLCQLSAGDVFLAQPNDSEVYHAYMKIHSDFEGLIANVVRLGDGSSDRWDQEVTVKRVPNAALTLYPKTR